MNRYKLTLEYAGEGFSGWQQQKGFPSVQETLQRAVEKLTQRSSTVQGAGRTDAGVHAWGQIAHVDVDKLWPEEQFQRGLNAHLKGIPVVVSRVEHVNLDFHARFSARFRHYTYCIACRGYPLVLSQGRKWSCYRPIDWPSMKQAAAYFVGTHDFSNFRSSLCQAKSALKTLTHLSFQQIDVQNMQIHFVAPSFLHHQVRMMVGLLQRVGIGKVPPSTVSLFLKNFQERKAPSAPAHGLYLTRVLYDEDLPLGPYTAALGDPVGDPVCDL